MAHIGFYTSGLLHQSFGHPQIESFITSSGPVFSHASRHPGFLSVAQTGEADAQTGENAIPRFCHGAEDRHVATLTLWEDLESVFAFAYRSLHADAMRRRKEWFQPSDLPNYAAWWVNEGHTPTWAEAVERYEHLADNGPTPFAFTFRTAFTADGHPVSVKRPHERQEIG